MKNRMYTAFCAGLLLLCVTTIVGIEANNRNNLLAGQIDRQIAEIIWTQ